MTRSDFVRRAIVRGGASFPQARAACFGGSAASGRVAASSDLDILTMLPDEWSSTSFVETTVYEGQLVEAFDYGPQALQS